jgi:hypothetical protein
MSFHPSERHMAFLKACHQILFLLRETLESLFNVSQFKLIPHLVFNVCGSSSSISLLHFLRLRFSIIYCKCPWPQHHCLSTKFPILGCPSFCAISTVLIPLSVKFSPLRVFKPHYLCIIFLTFVFLHMVYNLYDFSPSSSVLNLH